MMSNARCSRRRCVVLVIAATSLTGCAMVISEDGTVATCPPAVDYSPEFQARAADELALLPEESAIIAMLADYSVMREQARVCR